MRIEQLLDKKEQLMVSILKQLVLEGGSLPHSVLQESVGLSKQAYDNYVVEMGQFLSSHFKSDSNTAFVKNDGYQLCLDLPEKIGLSAIVGQFIEESSKYQILDYLLIHREFSINQLVSTLMLSESTVFRKIREINSVLKEFQIQIKNGRMVGEELQIRYFYYQLQLVVKVRNGHNRTATALEQSSASYQLFENALKKQLKTSFSRSAIQKLHCWLYVTQKRIIIKTLEQTDLSKRFTVFLNDPLFKDVDQIVSLYFSRSSVEDNIYESQMLYIFLISFFIFDEEYYYHYDLLRKKKLPTATLDVYIREMILLHYRPRRIALSLEKQVGYNLSQLNNQLYFFKGRIFEVDVHHLETELEHLLGRALSTLPTKLLRVALSRYYLKRDQHDGLQDYVLKSYSSVLSLIDFHSLKIITVGLDFDRDDTLGEPFRQLVTTELLAMNGLVVKEYVPKGRFDLVITTGYVDDWSVKAERVYAVSEFNSSYDIKKIKEIIYNLKRSVN